MYFLNVLLPASSAAKLKIQDAASCGVYSKDIVVTRLSYETWITCKLDSISLIVLCHNDVCYEEVLLYYVEVSRVLVKFSSSPRIHSELVLYASLIGKSFVMTLPTQGFTGSRVVQLFFIRQWAKSAFSLDFYASLVELWANAFLALASFRCPSTYPVLCGPMNWKLSFFFVSNHWAESLSWPVETKTHETNDFWFGTLSPSWNRSMKISSRLLR